jgi:hypothetical protein
MSFALLYITHESKAKAEELTDHLLQKKIIACANIFQFRAVIGGTPPFSTMMNGCPLLKRV